MPMVVLTTSSPWNSLEVIKVLLDATVPVALLLVGWLINRRLKQIEHWQWASQRAIDQRIRFYDDFVPQLNDIMCYFTYVGCWKELSPPQVIAAKRMLDRKANVFAPLFPADFLVLYEQFMDLCFKAFSGWGADARLRTRVRRRSEAAGGNWDSAWSTLFTIEEASEPAEVRAAYNHLVAYLAEQLGIGLTSASLPQGKVPSNVR